MGVYLWAQKWDDDDAENDDEEDQEHADNDCWGECCILWYYDYEVDGLVDVGADDNITNNKDLMNLRIITMVTGMLSAGFNLVKHGISVKINTLIINNSAYIILLCNY